MTVFNTRVQLFKPNQIWHGKQYENPQKVYIYHLDQTKYEM